MIVGEFGDPGLYVDFRDERRGALSIATTHTQARYVLPPVIQQFRQHYPDVKLHLHQGTTEQIADLAKHGKIEDLADIRDETDIVDLDQPTFMRHRRAVGETSGALYRGVGRMALDETDLDIPTFLRNRK